NRRPSGIRADFRRERSCGGGQTCVSRRRFHRPSGSGMASSAIRHGWSASAGTAKGGTGRRRAGILPYAANGPTRNKLAGTSTDNMAKRSLDDIHRKLISLLRCNARTPTAALGRQLALSRSAVQERLKRLERDGVIAGYTLVVGQD